MPPKRNEIPKNLRRLQPNEIDSIRSMFVFFDYECTGYIAKKHAEILLNQLGIEAATSAMADRLSLRDFLLFVDARLPESDPPLESSMVFSTYF